jgi:hypothetical protein
LVFAVEVLEHLGVGLFLLGGLAVAAEDADVGFDHKEYISILGKIFGWRREMQVL